LENVRTVIHYSGPPGLKAAFQRAGLPDTHFPAARATIDVSQKMEYLLKKTGVLSADSIYKAA